MIKKLSLVVLALTISSSSHAGILIDPYIGYEMQNVSATTSPKNLEGGGTGTATIFGGRLGYKFLLGLWVGVEHQVTSGGSHSPSASGAKSSTYTRSQTYAAAGFDLPILLRIWAGVLVANKKDLKGDNSTLDETFNGGSGYKLGVGTTLLPFVTVGLEYNVNKYSTHTLGTSVEGSIDNDYKSYDESTTNLVVTLPFNFGD